MPQVPRYFGVVVNGKDRKVDMSGQLTEVLSDLLSKRRAEALRREMEKPADERRDAATIVNEAMDDWLFRTPEIIAKSKDIAIPSRGGTQIDPSNLRKLFNRLLTDAKLRRVRFHDLRHSFASLLLQNSESLTYVKEQMGHSSINVTVDIYGHLVPGGEPASRGQARRCCNRRGNQENSVKTRVGNKSGNNWR